MKNDDTNFTDPMILGCLIIVVGVIGMLIGHGDQRMALFLYIGGFHCLIVALLRFAIRHKTPEASYG